VFRDHRDNGIVVLIIIVGEDGEAETHSYPVVTARNVQISSMQRATISGSNTISYPYMIIHLTGWVGSLE